MHEFMFPVQFLFSGNDKVLYGEWLYARHTVVYDKLPDWFLAFDVFDSRKGKFMCRSVVESHRGRRSSRKLVLLVIQYTPSMPTQARS